MIITNGASKKLENLQTAFTLFVILMDRPFANNLQLVSCQKLNDLI